MGLIQPFLALRPSHGHAGAVFSPPYDVLTTEEARLRAQGNPESFLHVSKPEIDLPADTDPYNPSVYAQGAGALKKLRDQGILQQDMTQSYSIYRLTQNNRPQTGLVAGVSIQAYRQGHVRRHEQTRPEKVKDRTLHLQALNAQTGPILMIYRDQTQCAALLNQLASQHPPQIDEIDQAGVQHQIWVIDQPDDIHAINQAFGTLDALYIADGHHRFAATEAAAQAHAAWTHCLSVLFPDNQLNILGYHRLVTHLNDLSLPAFKAALVKAGFALTPVDQAPQDLPPRHVGLYCDQQWYLLSTQHAPKDPMALDSQYLSEAILAPILGITDLRKDPHIHFVGGQDSHDQLQNTVDQGKAKLAFMLPAVPIATLLQIADAKAIMPPKSTWFEPKLADGLVGLVSPGSAKN